MAQHHVPLIIRGRIFDDPDLEFGGRRGETRFTTPDVSKHLDVLMLGEASGLSDLHRISFEDILQYLGDLGDRLTLGQNPYLQEAFELSCQTSGLGVEILRHCYETLGGFFNPDDLREIADATIGIPYLEGWVNRRLANGTQIGIRAFGARAVHIVSGNVPGVSALSILRNVLTRSDAIVKTPSNDPLTAAAIARTMVDMAPDHPITRHLSVGYWKGGDAAVEEALYQPRNIEKIVAWGGLASITHIAKYIQPGIDLITLDPKLSSSIVGREGFASDEMMVTAARRVARDIGMYNQEACVNARVIYIETGTDDDGIATANRFGQMVYDEIQALPSMVSSPATEMSPGLRQELEALMMSDDYYKTFGGGLEGAVIVSQEDEPVDFSRLLANRVANLVPVDSLDVPIRAVTAYTQTIGIFPETLKEQLRDRLAMQGAQRVVSLGYAGMGTFAGPQDGMEPLRRMCKWISDESYDPERIPLPTKAQA